ncbi:hypothetical protein FACS18947_4680 [Bacteroidia bacterium]|nr:hypothetical protein FACS18947_4680 [Bacteroidia bacterium]
MSKYVILGFLVGIALLVFGILYKKNKKIKVASIITGSVLSVAAVAIAMFLIFVLIPAM